MKKVCLLLLITAICVVGFTGKPSQSQVQDGQDQKFRVHVSVTCDDESLKNSVESHIKRELRSLGDVIIDIVGLDTYKIHVVLVEPTYKNTGTKTGNVSIAVLFLRRFDSRPLLNKYVKAGFKGDAAFETISLYHFKPEGLRVAYWTRNNIKQYCQELVANFDIQMLEKARQRM